MDSTAFRFWRVTVRATVITALQYSLLYNRLYCSAYHLPMLVSW